MITKPLDSLTEADLKALVEQQVEEGRHLDFKRDLPANADKDKLELCADVSSFANTGGGYLLYGIDESGGVASAVPGLPEVNIDAEILRLEQILAAGIDPPVPGLASRRVPIASKADVIAIRVPRSWRVPHLVKHGSSFRMYARTSRGKQPLDAQEIRRVFESSVDAAEAVGRWRDERIARILAADTPVPVGPEAKMVLHIVPLESLADPFRIPATAFAGGSTLFQPLGSGGWSNRINLDGHISYASDTGQGTEPAGATYCQAFRSGRIEAVSSSLTSDSNGTPLIASQWYERTILEGTWRYMQTLGQLDISYPMAVMLTLLGVRGACMAVDRSRFRAQVFPIDREVVRLPDVLFDSLPTNLPQALKPMFDAVWNACGIARSLNYDDKGNWSAGHLSGVPEEVIE